ncbi:MAG: 16S rRNA (guanine(527)-N(7))-methyltransferase RsmG [Treponema sp.]|jgi:16S rRNA (guanine527-N7)-methyltransferase|nr:16S rRNA (guanine(527)-N(7))-methyltransferase RsmG [Treponema sp.]
MANPLTEGLLALCAADPEISALLGPRLDAAAVLLDKYMDEIEALNPSRGLVKVSGREELVVKHILDSLAPLGHIVRLSGVPAAGGPAFLRPEFRIADAGSGAGLPGIPLAICLPGARISLIERAARRADFLRNAAAVLGLSNVTVEETEMEKAPPGRFDLVVFRAFRPLEQAVLKGLFRLLAPGGRLAAYKGTREKTEKEIAGLPPERREIYPLFVPFLNGERHFVVLGVPFSV